ncbi:MAG: DUF1353 domain-containing protein [Bradyrhizobium sp.]|uniref:DUF1353 domain-containing protein n=1 Tax=Bradyrhizobium sp. TaxID=376 RepID=UPI003D0BC6F3
MPFISDLVLRKERGARFTLGANLLYSYSAGEGDVIITVPAGTSTDLASIPRLMTPLFPVNDDHAAAAVLHDYLYGERTIGRTLADAIFRKAMSELGVPAWKRWPIWAAVRLFGGLYWNKKNR